MIKGDYSNRLETDMFKCDCCGLCCMNLRKSSLYKDLDRGDGVCKFFDFDKKLCSIYDSRPNKCNVDRSYELYYINTMTKEQYYNLNYQACKRLKKESEEGCI